MKLNSQIKLGLELPTANEIEVKSEPMLFRCDLENAYKLGGPLTHKFLNALPEDWKASPISVDSRVHMLMPGMFPCIPGWHHDDVPRERADGQPNYENPSYKAEHCMAIWGDCSLTEFAIGGHEIAIPPIGCKIYKLLSPQIDAMCVAGTLKSVTALPRRMVFFDWQTWHRGAPTTHIGFRFFIRASRNSMLPPINETRHNANVYMPVIDEGW